MKKNSFLLIALISYLFVGLHGLNAQAQQLPECKDNVSRMASSKKWPNGEHELCVTAEGTVIIAKVVNGKVASFSARDLNRNVLPLAKSAAGGKTKSIKCPAGMKSNCGCIPSNCFCEPILNQSN
ncbi:MAG: hypothetical protein JNK69_11940 [Saprospiraceae bacterium]|nr:hypothetical protein [Candidatus Vicinibacter proximus]MBL7824108.1 hypothetical protein [Saprospiraceae bacterium]MCC6841482.1 hypothetical protein [Saprospiraceae bacterium]HRG34033.1 hypothetical protein [Saprospiraceae bacterium]